MKIIASWIAKEVDLQVDVLPHNYEDNRALFRELYRVWTSLSEQFGILALDQFVIRVGEVYRRDLYFVTENPPTQEVFRAIMTQRFNARRITEDCGEEWGFEL